jgi:hypothetical protein
MAVLLFVLQPTTPRPSPPKKNFLNHSAFLVTKPFLGTQQGRRGRASITLAGKIRREGGPRWGSTSSAEHFAARSPLGQHFRKRSRGRDDALHGKQADPRLSPGEGLAKLLERNGFFALRGHHFGTNASYPSHMAKFMSRVDSGTDAQPSSSGSGCSSSDADSRCSSGSGSPSVFGSFSTSMGRIGCLVASIRVSTSTT